MIAKGNLHAHGGRLAAYLTTGKDGERAELIEMRGIAAASLRDGFRDIQCIAAGQTRCAKPFFHAYVRLPGGEGLDPATWVAVADRLEAALGFDGQPRAVAFHIGADGERHMHTAWSRIDMDDMRAIDPGLYKNKLKEVCRALEAEYGLQAVRNARAPEQQTKAPARDEFEESRRLGLEVEATRETIRACYDRSDNGRSFVAALAEHGLGLARGDRRDFVVIDGEGGQHALGHRICGATAGDIRQRLGVAFRQSLPRVDALREQMEDRRNTADRTQTNSTRPKTRAEIAAEVTSVWVASDSGKVFQAEIEARGYMLARGDRRDFLLIDGAAKPHSLPRLIGGARVADVRAKLADIDINRLPDAAEAQATMGLRSAITDHRRRRGGMDEVLTEDGLKQQALREAEQLAAAQAIKERLTKFEAQKQSEAQTARQDEQQRRQADERRSAEGEPNDAKGRYAQALAQHYDIRDPYGSLSRAAMAEYGQFVRQREEMRKEAAGEKDPAKRAEIEVRMKIEACDYMAITSQRLAGISADIAGRQDAPQAQADRERAVFWQQEGAKAREQRAQMIEARQAQQPPRTATNDRGDQSRTADAPRTNDAAATPAAASPARRADREAEEYKAAGMDKGQIPTQQPIRAQQGRGGGRGGGGR